MQRENHIFVHFANLLSYPERAKLTHAGLLLKRLAANPGYAQQLAPFFQFIEQTPLKSIEEIFTSTFDLNAACCLEIGWHLYGEDYKRGEFLVNMRQALQEVQVSESVELPDHMSHCLRLLATLDFEDGQAFSRRFLLPAIGKILKNLDESNPYRQLLMLLQEILQTHFGVAADEPMLAEGPIVVAPSGVFPCDLEKR